MRLFERLNFIGYESLNLWFCKRFICLLLLRKKFCFAKGYYERKIREQILVALFVRKVFVRNWFLLAFYWFFFFLVITWGVCEGNFYEQNYFVCLCYLRLWYHGFGCDSCCKAFGVIPYFKRLLLPTILRKKTLPIFFKFCDTRLFCNTRP